MRDFLYRVVTGEDKSAGAYALRPFLFVLSVIYFAGLCLRRAFYTIGLCKSEAVGRPVISVGNITAGGVGKTPFVVYLARYIQSQKRNPAVLTRGYMTSTAQESDEAAMMRELLNGVPVYASPDRVRSAKQALDEHIVDVFLLDDGFQHWRVKRDLDIVVVDASCPFSNGELLPSGLLREPLSALDRADVVVVNRADKASDLSKLRLELGRRAPRSLIVETAVRPVCLREPFTGWIHKDFSLLNDDIAAFCAIGNPALFASSLEALGGQLKLFKTFPDHYPYSANDVSSLLESCRQKGLKKVVTTHKDAVKIAAFRELFSEVKLLVLDVSVCALRGENELFSRINSLRRS